MINCITFFILLILNSSIWLSYPSSFIHSHELSCGVSHVTPCIPLVSQMKFKGKLSFSFISRHFSHPLFWHWIHLLAIARSSERDKFFLQRGPNLFFIFSAAWKAQKTILHPWNFFRAEFHVALSPSRSRTKTAVAKWGATWITCSNIWSNVLIFSLVIPVVTKISMSCPALKNYLNKWFFCNSYFHNQKKMSSRKIPVVIWLKKDHLWIPHLTSERPNVTSLVRTTHCSGFDFIIWGSWNEIADGHWGGKSLSKIEHVHPSLFNVSTSARNDSAGDIPPLTTFCIFL